MKKYSIISMLFIVGFSSTIFADSFFQSICKRLFSNPLQENLIPALFNNLSDSFQAMSEQQFNKFKNAPVTIIQDLSDNKKLAIIGYGAQIMKLQNTNDEKDEIVGILQNNYKHVGEMVSQYHLAGWYNITVLVDLNTVLIAIIPDSEIGDHGQVGTLFYKMNNNNRELPAA